MLYAIAKINGKQYKITEDQELTVDRLPVGEGKTTDIKDVLYVSQDDNKLIGDDAKKATIKAKVIEEFQGPKVLVFKYKKRKRHRKLTGHRQALTTIKIQSIDFPGKKKEVKQAPKKKAVPKEQPKDIKQDAKKEVTKKDKSAEKKTTGSSAVKKTTAAKSTEPKKVPKKETKKADAGSKPGSKKEQKKV